MNDLISRQALCEYALNQKDKSVTPNDIMRFPSMRKGEPMDLSKPFDKNDFVGSGSLLGPNEFLYWDPVDTPEANVTYRSDGCPYELVVTPKGALYMLIDTLNMLRELYLKTGNSTYKDQIETLLPRSYKERSDV